MTSKELFEAGRLSEALELVTQEVKRHPTDPSARGFLCELLCFAGQWDRADLHLDALLDQNPGSAVGLAAFRHLLRAEEARQQLFTDGRVPEFLAAPSPPLRLHLEATVRLRTGNSAEAAELLTQAEQQRAPLKGTCDGVAFDDLRDLDDVTACFFEVLTSNGKYYWIPMEAVDLIEFRAPERPRDLLWRRAHLVVRDGPDGEVFFPALYPRTCADPDDRVRLGQITEWRGGSGEPVRGRGQRILLVGEEDRPMLQIQELHLDGPGG